jgi:gliding motility-associated lipoprotein GldH
MKIRRNSIVLIATFAAIIGMITSCGEGAYYDDVYSFENKTWHKSDTASFVVPVTDTTNLFKFSISLRTTASYEYSNLWIYILSTSPDGSTSKVAQKLPLARPDGSWIGNVSGTVVQTDVRFAAKHFPLKGDYSFEFINATQQEEVEHVLDIGLRVKK